MNNQREAEFKTCQFQTLRREEKVRSSHFFRSADNPVRLGVIMSAGADKIFRAPNAHRGEAGFFAVKSHPILTDS
jgi:hypothetical protein